MVVTVRVRFYGELRIFLLRRFSAAAFSCPVREKTSIKDLVESLGVPHTQIDALFVNGKPVNFSYLIFDKDSIRVYPDASRLRFAAPKKLQPRNPHNPKFIADVHLGKVARILRLLGFDVFLDAALSDTDIINQSLKNKRIILTRDRGILKQRRVRYGYYVKEDSLEEQMRSIIKRYALKDKIKPFTRCSKCNGQLKVVAKQKILAQLPSLTRQYYNEFYRCSGCGKIYWPGTHLPSLLTTLKRIIPGGVVKNPAKTP